MIVGKRKHTTVLSVDYHREVCKDFFNDLYENFYKFEDGWAKEFWNELFIEYDHNVHMAIEYPPDITP